MMLQQKLLFIDRDGTLIVEPDDFQVDTLSKIALMPNVIPALLRLQQAEYRFIMISNQDGLGTDSFPYVSFSEPHEFMLNLFLSQGISFESILICPHLPIDECDCRKPKLGLVLDYLTQQKMCLNNSYVIGDRETDIQLANKMGIKSFRIGQNNLTWTQIADQILHSERRARLSRNTNETKITVEIDLNRQNSISIHTGISFFDHMLEQFAKHGGFNLSLTATGDQHIDDHHIVEDTAIVLGEAFRKALNNKIGINRYGFTLPMDESLAEIALDLGGRSYFSFEGKFNREKVGDFSTELVSHFFRSLAESLKASLHIQVKGENTHHMIESIFKCTGRALRQAITITHDRLPSTKGVL